MHQRRDLPSVSKSPSASASPFESISVGKSVRIEILAPDGRFCGLGQVTILGTPLRSGARAILPEIRSPDAVHFCQFYLNGIAEVLGGSGSRLNLGLSRRDGGAMEWMVHSVRQRYRRSNWSESPRRADDTGLILEIKPVSRVVGGQIATGFSYQYLYSSKSVAIYKITDQATWEPGGHATGNEFWLRNAFSSPIRRFESVEDAYSSEWYLPSATNPNVFEFLPFQSQLSGFTLTAHAQGTLITWVPQVAHIRSLFEKPADCDEIVHLHELCGDLSCEFAPPPIEVLWFPGERNRVDQLNLYEDMRSLVSQTLHQQVGMRVERAYSYGMIEEWENCDLRHYAKGLPKLAEAGVEVVGLANHFENNMNAYGVTNMCCTTDLRVAESVGEEKLFYFCDQAAQRDMRVEMWGNTSLSTIGWLTNQPSGQEDRIRFSKGVRTVFDELRESEDPWVRNPSNAIEADHYTPVFLVMNLRDETVRRIWLQRWRDAHDRLGLRGIFLDSSFNLSSDKFHWIARPKAGSHGGTSDQTHLLGHARPKEEPGSAILSQFQAHLTLMAEMQRMGYSYCGEDIGVFGIHRAGARLSFLVDCLALWVDILPDFDPVELTRLGCDPDEIFFRGLAYRAVWKLQWDPRHERLTWMIGKAEDPRYTPTPEQLSAIKAYRKVRAFLDRRRVLPEEKGVVYHGNGKTVFWSFSPFAVTVGDGAVKVSDVLTGESFVAKGFEAKSRGLYLIDSEVALLAD